MALHFANYNFLKGHNTDLDFWTPGSPRHETLSPSLGNLAWFRLISVGARFIRERKIWGAGPLPYFPFSPTEEDRAQRG